MSINPQLATEYRDEFVDDEHPEERLDRFDIDIPDENNDGIVHSTPDYVSNSPPGRNGINNNNGNMTLSQEKYSMMMNMTLDLVQNLTSVREGDPVYTAYGRGICIQKHSTRNPSMQVALSFGTLYHRQPEMIHKLIDDNTYSEAMDHLDQVRKLQWTMQCEQWNVSPAGRENECVACLFQKPHWHGDNASPTSNVSNRKSWFRRSGSASTSRNNNNNTNSFRLRPNAAVTYKTCDVCGNPVCSQHIINNQSSANFVMCVDCQFDLNNVVQKGSNSSTKGLLDPNHPQLPQTLDRLLQYYTRMVLQLQFWIPQATKGLAQSLTDSERSNAKVALGTGGLSFVGAALGVAGAAALMTPPGHLILLAAVATSATSATIQGTHAGVHRYRLKSSTSQLSQVHALSDRLLGWHGLCLGILNALEELRFQLLCEHEAVLQVLQQQQQQRTKKLLTGENQATSGVVKLSASAIQQHRRASKRHGNGNGSASSNKALEVWNTLAVGSFHTTRHGLTGVGLTSAMGASYSQLISASMQSVPVVGAAFSVGCMAMDASNIASTINKLSKPADKAVALLQVEESFIIHVPSTISLEVAALLNAVRDLRLLQDDAQRNQQQDLIEKELEELNFA
ncbi:hypothetical protein IV203_009873 [Nitzschia inconspicua]|uniref:Uncharacterized protein n=1 Tax=Nitzschia inconspicua TaxID=303405 RepID=A0A9K3KV19_9STRA|nr:hypothetical protein IV203_009873 [Nitzschia inconspicua]